MSYFKSDLVIDFMLRFKIAIKEQQCNVELFPPPIG